MTPEKIRRATEAAQEFLTRAAAYEQAVDYWRRYDAWQAEHIARGLPVKEVGLDDWKRINGGGPRVFVASGALRRQSMELTRALAELRKP